MRVLLLGMLLTFAVFCEPFAVADEVLDESEAIAKIEQLGGTIIDGRPRGMSVNLEAVPTLAIPYWAITVPLTVLSLWLLLSNPRNLQ